MSHRPTRRQLLSTTLALAATAAAPAWAQPKSVRLVESLWDPANRTFKKGAILASNQAISNEAQNSSVLLDRRTGTVRITNPKGGGSRAVQLSRYTQRLVNRYLDLRAPLQTVCIAEHKEPSAVASESLSDQYTLRVGVAQYQVLLIEVPKINEQKGLQ